jgi:hypothetical protein
MTLAFPEKWHGSTRIQGHAFLAVVYIYYLTAAGNSVSSQLGSSCQGNRYGTEKAGGRYGPSITYKNKPELEFFPHSMWARNREGIGLSYRPAGYIGWRNWLLGIDSRAPYKFKNVGSAGSLSSSQPGGPPCWTSPLALGTIYRIRNILLVSFFRFL